MMLSSSIPGEIGSSHPAYEQYFAALGSTVFAATMAAQCPIFVDEAIGSQTVMTLSDEQVLEAASRHGDIGQKNRALLDAHAKSEQGRVATEGAVVDALITEGEAYKSRFGVKFLISAQGKTAEELLGLLRQRSSNSRDVEWHNARIALWQIALKRLSLPDSRLLSPSLCAELIKKYPNVPSLVATVSLPTGQQSFALNNHLSQRQPATCETVFEIASLSKTIAAALAIEFLHGKGIPLETSVNKLLEMTESPFRIRREGAVKGEGDWTADEVTCAHLMSHHALNMHYVNGVPANRPMPPIKEFINGNTEYGYVPVVAIHKPGTVFQYSGGGFIVLEHLLESLGHMSIHDIARPFLSKLGLTSLTFEQWDRPNIDFAVGSRDDGKPIEGGRLMFPAFAAGAMSTTDDVAKFLRHLTSAYEDLNGSGPISHDTARLMLHGFDHGCRKFMGCLMGLGVFIAEAGDNKFAIHQGANDGFRCIFAHCFTGPNKGTGFCIAANAELSAVKLISELSQHLLQKMGIGGIDFSKFKLSFSSDNVKQEEVVNTGFRELIFDAFLPQRPEAIVRNPSADQHDEYGSRNVLLDAEVVYCSNDLFARCENLISPFQPTFDPALFGKQGKVMDSWESVRHNQRPSDAVTFVLKNPCKRPRFVRVSTKFHLGNQAPAIRIIGYSSQQLGRTLGSDESFACSTTKPLPSGVVELLPVTPLAGHSLLQVDLGTLVSTHIEACTIQNIPDGGITRVQIIDEGNVPCEAVPLFSALGEAKCVPWADEIPKAVKPLVAPYSATPAEIQEAVAAAQMQVAAGQEVNVANSLLGAKIVSVSNEHYSPAVQVISPLPPINMFDGLESARSRISGSFESVVIQLAWPCSISSIVCDFTFFVNNNPRHVTISGRLEGHEDWMQIIINDFVKSFAASKKRYQRSSCVVGSPALFGDSSHKFSHIRLQTFPCGGINRVMVFTQEKVK